MLGFFKECHDKYGAVFSLYCYYESEDFNLGMVPGSYRDEFVENSDWLKFGFHYKDGKEPTEISAEEIIRDYEELTSELIRITGSTCSTVRLSCFKGSYEVSMDNNQNRIISVFTHEWLMGQGMYNKIETVCKFVGHYNYKWTLLEQ